MHSDMGMHQAAHDAGGEHHRQEHAHRGEGGGHHRHAHLLCALHGSAGRRDAPAAQTVDVLNDDHRVIHQHTNAEGEARKGHDVQVQPGKVHEHHGEQNGQRDADADHEGGLYSFRKMASTMMASAAPTAMLVRMLLMMMVM